MNSFDAFRVHALTQLTRIPETMRNFASHCMVIGAMTAVTLADGDGALLARLSTLEKMIRADGYTAILLDFGEDEPTSEVLTALAEAKGAVLN